jgi:hypothetical protein
MGTTMQETFERSSSRPADRSERLCRVVDDVRVRAHLRRAESALRSAEHDLSPERRRRRERHLDRLAAYRARGEVPANRSEPERVPLFVGDDGTPCAMAHLLGEDGREDLVTAVMAEEPTVRIEDLPDDHPVVEWVEANGLTREEAARIQPTYPGGVQFATTCGPVPCWVAGAVASVVGLAAAGAIEYVGYRLVDDAFPDNALKRRATLSYLTVLALFVAPLVALVVFALFP